MIRLLAFDLDGTLTQHRTPLGERNRDLLTELSRSYRLVIVGAGMCRRIFDQLGGFPIDVIGNYGMQYAEFDPGRGDIVIKDDRHAPCDKESVIRRADAIRSRYGFTEYKGDGVEFHSSGCVTLPLLGTRADIKDKLAFDPDRSRRRAIYAQIKETFPEYTVFVGGSSSFDMAPRPYDKYSALDKYCSEHGFTHAETAYFGDDYGPGGNDESVYSSDFLFIKVDDHLDLPRIAEPFLKR